MRGIRRGWFWCRLRRVWEGLVHREAGVCRGVGASPIDSSFGSVDTKRVYRLSRGGAMLISHPEPGIEVGYPSYRQIDQYQFNVGG